MEYDPPKLVGRLTQIFYEDRECEKLIEQLQELEAKLESSTQRLMLAPGKGPDSNLKEKYINLKNKLEDLKENLEQHVLDARYYIAGLDDSLVRLVLTFRYLDLNSWEEVAANIGGGMTAESARKIAYRFFLN